MRSNWPGMHDLHKDIVRLTVSGPCISWLQTQSYPHLTTQRIPNPVPLYRETRRITRWQTVKRQINTRNYVRLTPLVRLRAVPRPALHACLPRQLLALHWMLDRLVLWHDRPTADFMDKRLSNEWVSEQCFTSPPTQYRLYGRRF